MVAALGPSTPAIAAGSVPSQTSLQADIDACRRQLADWVTCPSAKTPQGHARIQQIAARMAAAQSRLDAAAAGPPTGSSPPAFSSATHGIDVYA